MSIQPPVFSLSPFSPKGKTDRLFIDSKPGIVESEIDVSPSQSDRVILSPHLSKSDDKTRAQLLSRLSSHLLGQARKITGSVTESDLKDEVGVPLIHVLARENDETAVKMLVQNLQRNVNATDDFERNALHVLEDSQDSMANVLMDLGADPNAWDVTGKTPLYRAASQNKPALLKAFLRNPNIKPNREDDHLNTPLHAAIDQGHLRIIETLAQYPKTRFDMENCDNETALDLAAKKGGEAERILKEAEAARVKESSRKKTNEKSDLLSPSSCDIDPPKVLSRGSTAGHFEVQRPEKNSNVSPIASNASNTGDSQLLSKRDEARDTLLHWAARQGKMDLVKALVNTPEVNLFSRNPEGKTAFQLASQNGHQKIARFLLSLPWRSQR